MTAQFLLDQLNAYFGTQLILAYTDDEGQSFDLESSAEARRWFNLPNPQEDPNLIIVDYGYIDGAFLITLCLMSYEDISEELARRRLALRITGVNFSPTEL